MSTSTKWIRFSPNVSIAMTIQGNWVADSKETRDRLFELVDRFMAAEMPEPEQQEGLTRPEGE